MMYNFTLAPIHYRIVALLVIFAALTGTVFGAGIQRMMFIPQAPVRVALRANARAIAHCLDIRAKTRPGGHEFKYSAASKEDLSADTAGKIYTIQSAIDAGKIAVLGTGDHESLEIKSLTDDEVVVAPKAPVAVLPDKTSKTDDLVESLAALPQQASDEIGQTAVWDEREKHIVPKALPKLGFKSEEVEFEHGRTYVKNGGSLYRFDSDAMIRWQQAVRTQNVESGERDPLR
jgi:hypothetical protein